MCFLFGCQSDTQQQASQAQTDLIGTQNDVAKFGLSSAKGTIGPATGAVTGAQNWFSKLLNGDPLAVGNAVAPAVQSLTSQYTQLKQQTKDLLPSGGERNKLLADLPFRQASDVAKLVGGAQKEGATGLLDIAQLLFGTTTGLLGGSTAAAGTGGAIAGQQYDQAIQQQQQQQQAGASIGSLIGLLVGL